MITLPELPYAYEALSPTISAETMRTHHDKHHAKYVDMTNKLAAENGLDGRSLEEIVAEADAKKLQKLFNNAAQAWNHAFFWDCMTPERRDPRGELMSAIGGAFGDLAGLKKKFVEEGAGHFASGWVWLAADGADLVVLSTHDAGTLAHDKRTPLLVCDVWEHAYYLDYKQDRQGFLERWFDSLADWEFAEAQYEAAQGRHAPWTFAEAA
jgi:Fe-Mn family superoxide dismutase